MTAAPDRPAAPRREGRLRSLAGLRLVAALMVAVYHWPGAAGR